MNLRCAVMHFWGVVNNAFVIKYFLVELGVMCDSQTNFKKNPKPKLQKKETR